MKLNYLRNTGYILVIAIGWAFFICFSFYHFLGVGPDDVFIFLWSGENLNKSSWFVNYNFQTQEMVSSVLVPLLIKLISIFISNEAFFLSYKILGLLSASMVFWIIWGGRNYLFGTYQSDLLAFFAIGATIFSPIFQYWSLGGMETPYQSVLYTFLPIAIVLYSENRKFLNWSTLVLTNILIVLVRAEGFLFVFLTAIFLVFHKQFYNDKWRKRDIFAILIPIVFFLMLLMARWLATNSIWPNPVLAKVGTFNITIYFGIDYIARYYLSSPLAFFHGIGLLITIIFFAHNMRSYFLRKELFPIPYGIMIGAAIIIANDVFVILVGGNWMELFRFLVPTLPLKNALLGWVGYQVVQILRRQILRRFYIIKPYYKAAYLVLLITILSFSVTLIKTQQHILDKNSEIALYQQPTLPNDFFKGSIADINQKARMLSGIIQMEPKLRKFLEGPLQDIVRKSNKQLVLLSAQAGLLPYMIREYFNQNQIWFIDPLGLASKEMAELNMPKTSFGNAFTNVDIVLLGKVGKLSEEVIKKNPDLVCILNPTQEERSNLTDKLGFQLIWDQPACAVYYNGHLEKQSIDPTKQTEQGG